jgi:hypothetical protein
VSFGYVSRDLCGLRFMIRMVGREVVKAEQYTLLGLDSLFGENVYVRSDCKWW